jgi:hypothetical protein
MVMPYIDYASPTYTDGRPGIWADVEDSRYQGGGYRIHVHIAELIEGPETQLRTMVLRHARKTDSKWLRDMITKAEVESQASTAA